MGGARAAGTGSWAVQEEAGTWQLSSRAHATGEQPSCQSLSHQEPALCPLAPQCLPLARLGGKSGQGLRGALCRRRQGDRGKEDMAARRECAIGEIAPAPASRMGRSLQFPQDSEA